MKKIVMAFALVQNDDSVSAEQIRDVLSKLGTLSVYAQDDIVVAPVKEDATSTVSIFISPDEDVPYMLVDGQESEGRELEDAEVENLRFHGICTEFFARYPRPDRYGAPLYAALDVYAESIVADHRFVVAQEDFTVHSVSSGDDSSECVWLTLSVPNSLHAELMRTGGQHVN